MRAARRSTVAFVLSALIVGLNACSNSSEPRPPAEAWRAVALQGGPARGILMDIAFSGGRALAVGTAAVGVPPTADYTPFVAEPGEGGAWRRATPPALPEAGLLTAVGFTAGSEAIMAGADVRPPGQGFVLDERGGWNRIDVSLGALALATSGGVTRLAGMGGAPALVSLAADSWSAESLPFPSTTGERGLVDIAARDGVWVACGYDDGAEGTPDSPHAVLFRNGGAGWQRVAVPCGGCSNREFRAVAVSATGGLLLGGAITDYGAGAADASVAFLLVRSVAGDWTEIVLPGAGRLDRVNDILAASDGSIYLACGLDGAHCVVRSPSGAPAACELSLERARIEALGEGPGGVLYAVGATLDAGNSALQSPALWRRSE
jgi:hypothetical protein